MGKGSQLRNLIIKTLLASIAIAMIGCAIGVQAQLSAKEHAEVQFSKWQRRVDDLSNVPMSADLLDSDEISISNSLNSLNSRRSRVRLKLGLLESSIKKYREAKKTLDALKTKKSPSEKLNNK